MEKQYSHKTWASFYDDKFNFGVISIDSFIALFCFVIWRKLQLHLQKKSFFEWMCFLHLPIITNSKGKGNEKQKWIHEQVLTPRAVTGRAEALQRRDFLQQYLLNEHVVWTLELQTFNILAAIDNQLIINYFLDVENVLKWQYPTNDRFINEIYDSATWIYIPRSHRNRMYKRG